jgi:hypothetical protein
VDTSSAAGTVANDQRVVVVPEGGEAIFGRDPDVNLRIGHAPFYDDVVPRRAGRIFHHEDRLVVANTDDALALDIRVKDRPLITVPPGDWHAPRDRAFDVVVTGTFAYDLAVTVNIDRNPTRLLAPEHDPSDQPEPPTGARPRLTDRQRKILDAYVAPLSGGGSAASHQAVAETLGVSRSLVRLECNRIWSELLVAGVPMRDFGDARDAIVDAWSRHRI